MARRFPYKRRRFVRSGLKVTSITGFLGGMGHVFQPSKASGLNTVDHFVFAGAKMRSATALIANGRLMVDDGLTGRMDIRLRADGSASSPSASASLREDQAFRKSGWILRTQKPWIEGEALARCILTRVWGTSADCPGAVTRARAVIRGVS